MSLLHENINRIKTLMNITEGESLFPSEDKRHLENFVDLVVKELGIERLQFNYCGSPNYTSVEADEDIEIYNEKYKEFLKTFTGMQLGRPEYLYTRKYNNVEKHKVKVWIDFMNSKRGFDIREIVPELSKF